ncbi:MAG TPA: SURF1 family protein [Nocardioides sp.]|nr:SURF1 family protein [Nocardioides sp.]
MRFLLSRRWLLFAVAVALLAYGAWWLGEWQFGRLEERRARNEVTARNLTAPPAPVEKVLAPGRPVDPQDEWRRVRAAGTYLAEETVVVRYQTHDGASGVDLVTPLRLRPDGPLLLVNRGWLRTDNTGDAASDLPPPPAGRVTVVGWVRGDATGDAAEVSDRTTRAVSSREIAGTLDGAVLGGFVDLVSEQPEPAEPLVHAEAPDLSEGPHFFYGLQWWFFAALGVFGFGYLAWDERRKGRPAAAQGAGSTVTKVGESAPS